MSTRSGSKLKHGRNKNGISTLLLRSIVSTNFKSLPDRLRPQIQALRDDANSVSTGSSSDTHHTSRSFQLFREPHFRSRIPLLKGKCLQLDVSRLSCCALDHAECRRVVATQDLLRSLSDTTGLLDDHVAGEGEEDLPVGHSSRWR